MKKPNLFIIGFPKCGTTSIANYLSQHKDIYFSPIKEPHYFASDFNTREINKIKTIEEYMSLFSEAGEERFIAEGSTGYIYSDCAIERIENFCENARYIVCVRNPVYMVQSLHAQMLRSGHEDVEDFYEAWGLSDERWAGECLNDRIKDRIFVSYKQFGRISIYLDRLLNKVDIKRIKFVFFDDLERDARRVYVDILSFLGLEDDGRCEFERFNRRGFHRSKLIKDFVNNPPEMLVGINERLKKVVGVKRIGFIDWLRRKNTYFVEPRLDEGLLREMERYFERDILYMRDLKKKMRE